MRLSLKAKTVLLVSLVCLFIVVPLVAAQTETPSPTATLTPEWYDNPVTVVIVVAVIVIIILLLKAFMK